MSGIYEHNGIQLYGDGREVEPLPSCKHAEVTDSGFCKWCGEYRGAPQRRRSK